MMVKTQHEKLKSKIVTVVMRNGLALRTQTIADRIALPDGTNLGDLLNELVAEGRLTESYTLLSNGDKGVLYNVHAR
jgi:hypothetical protein